MEQGHPRKKKFKEVDSSERIHSQDKASYYQGKNFEMDGVEFGPEDGQIEEQERNLARFGEKFWNEKDYVGLGPELRKSDEDIFQEVCETLTDNPGLNASEIEVEVHNGCVYLRGRVSSRRDKQEAERSVEYLPGVKDVMNEIHFNC